MDKNNEPIMGLDVPICASQEAKAKGNEIAKESEHWYNPDGSPAYTVVGKNGKERSSTLADAKKLGLVPSVTKIIRCAAAPGLEAWKTNQLLAAALTLPAKEGETLDDYAKRVIEDSKAQTNKARERGSALHTAIELSIQGKEYNVLYQLHIKKLRDTLEQLGVNLDEGSAEHSFARLGYGGKIDYHNNLMVDPIVIDFKSKDKIEDGKRLAFDEHAMQLGAYAKGLNMTNPRAISVFIGVDDCEIRVHEWSPEDLLRGWKQFACLLEYWYLTSGLERTFGQRAPCLDAISSA